LHVLHLQVQFEPLDLVLLLLALLAKQLYRFVCFCKFFQHFLFIFFSLCNLFFGLSRVLLKLLLLGLKLFQELFVFDLKFLYAVLNALDVQLELLLDADVLPHVSLQVLDQLLVHIWATGDGICVD